jgi:hypothetical protein
MNQGRTVEALDFFRQAWRRDSSNDVGSGPDWAKKDSIDSLGMAAMGGR